MRGIGRKDMVRIETQKEGRKRRGERRRKKKGWKRETEMKVIIFI